MEVALVELEKLVAQPELVLDAAAAALYGPEPVLPRGVPALFQPQGKVRPRPGPARVVGVLAWPRHTNRTVATAPLDPCTRGTSAQRGNTRRTYLVHVSVKTTYDAKYKGGLVF